MAHGKDLTHFDAHGRPRMVDVSAKAETARSARASGFVSMSADALAAVEAGHSKKGDASVVAELAGVMGAKKTADLIPLCHPLALSGVNVETAIEAGGVRVIARVKTAGATGVEMEALTAVATACLTLYDMLKAIDRTMTISDIRLEEKTGGAAGDFKRETGP